MKTRITFSKMEPNTGASGDGAVMDAINNPKLPAISAHEIKLEKVGNESIGVCAGNKRIMKIRFKFESEKMASSLKLSGDPW